MEKTIETQLQAISELLTTATLAAKEVLTIEEAALFMGLKKSQLYQLTHKKAVPHYKPEGKVVYFSRPEIETWLLRNRVSTAEELTEKAQAYCMKHKPFSNK
ncbi:hypothetical protein FACS1894156_9210 [Bacteroidia bacterium]|nr:hypothetical protein FACS1894156_9210 [Bacteroidia bacterium]